MKADVEIRTPSGASIRATAVCERVAISQGAYLVGFGTLWTHRDALTGATSYRIECDARLGLPDGSETQGAYDALEQALAKAGA